MPPGTRGETSGSGAKVSASGSYVIQRRRRTFNLPDQEIVRRKYQCRPIPVTAHQFAIEDIRCIRHKLHYGAPAISSQSVFYATALYL